MGGVSPREANRFGGGFTSPRGATPSSAPSGGGASAPRDVARAVSKVGNTVSTAASALGGAVNSSPFYSPPPSGSSWGTPGAPAAAPSQPSPFDMTVPGAQQTAFAQHGDQFLQPGQTQDFWKQYQDRFTGPTASENYFETLMQQATPQGSNNSQNYFEGFQNRAVGAPANLDPYYERARERTTQDINSAMASRGMYNSSTATGAIGDAMVGLNAEQANREADYNLQRLSAMLGYDVAGANMAGAADATSARNAGLQLQDMLARAGVAGQVDDATLGRLMGAAGITGQIDANTLNNLMAYFGAAAQSQGFGDTRAQNYFDNILRSSTASAGFTGSGFENMFASDEEMLMQELMHRLGLSAEMVNQDYRNQEKIKSDTEWWANIISSYMSGGATGGLGGGTVAA